MVFVIIVAIRCMAAFVGLILCAKLLGQPFKTLSGVALGTMAAIVALGGFVPWWTGITVMIIWGGLALLAAFLRLKVPAIRDFLDGKPTMLIQHGKVLQDKLKKSRMTAYDMMALLREKNAFKLADVEFGMLEPDGQISVMLKSDRQPATPLQHNLPIELEAAPMVVVVDGNILPKALADTGFDRAWLWEQITNQGAKDWKDVFLAQVSSSGSVYVDLYEDVLPQPQMKQKPLLLATLKKFKTDFDMYALQTDNQAAKTLYEDLSEQMTILIRKVEGYLRG